MTPGNDRRVNLVVEPVERREGLFESFPEVFFSLGGWSRLGTSRWTEIAAIQSTPVGVTAASWVRNGSSRRKE